MRLASRTPPGKPATPPPRPWPARNGRVRRAGRTVPRLFWLLSLLAGSAAVAWYGTGGRPGTPVSMPAPALDAGTDGPDGGAVMDTEVSQPSLNALHFEVVDAQENPVSKASVGLIGGRLWPASMCTTDAVGRCSMPRPRPGFYLARAWNAQSTVQDGFKLEAQEEPGPRKLRLQPGGKLTLTLRAKDGGAPVANAPVTLRDPEVGLPPRAARTDAGGRVHFEGLHPGSHSIQARADGFLPGWEITEIHPSMTREQTLTLIRPRRLEGVVLDPDGAPLAAARVQVMGPPVTRPMRSVRGDTDPWNLGTSPKPVPAIPQAAGTVPDLPVGPPVKTDNAGRFQLQGLPDAPLSVWVRHPRYAQQETALSLPTGAAQNVAMRIQMGRPGQLEVDSLSSRGESLDGVRIRIENERGWLLAETRSDGGGAARIENMLGKVHVRGRAAGMSPGHCTVTIRPEQEARCALHMSRLDQQLTLQVVDEAGFGIEQVEVLLRQPGTTFSWRAQTGGDGRAELKGLPAPPYALDLRARGRVERLGIAVEEVTGELEQTLSEGFDLRLKIEDNNGRAVPGASVSLRQTDSGERREAGAQRSNRAGRLTLRDMPAGPWLARASHPALGESAPRPTMLGPRQATSPVTLQLSGAAAAHSADPGQSADSAPKATRIALRWHDDHVVVTGAPTQGLRPGDVLLEVDDEDVLGVGQARGMLRDPPGQRKRLAIRRSGRKRTLSWRTPDLP